MRIFNLIGEGFHALRSFIITKESAMTDTSIINSTAPAADAELPQFAIPDSNVPTDPQLQRLSSPSTVAPATSEETPGETHAAPDAAAQHTPPANSDQSATPDAAAVQPAEQSAAPDAAAQPVEQSAAPDAAAAQPAEQSAAPDAAAQPVDQSATPDAAAAQPAEQSTPPDAAAQPVEQAAAANASPQAQAPVADTATQQASAQAVNAAERAAAPAAQSGSDVAAAPAAQSAEKEEQSEFSAGVKDFGAAFDFVQQGIEHLGSAARKELFELARKYL